MARVYNLEPIDLEFFSTAPVIHRFEANLPVTPARAWEEFTRQNTLDWCRAINDIEFTSPAPYGEGTTRRASLGRGLAGLSEYFFVWDENPHIATDGKDEGNYRNAFYADTASTPGLKRFGELTEIHPADVGCRLVWTFAIELKTSSRVVNAFSGPTASSVFATIENDTRKHFANLSPQA